MATEAPQELPTLPDTATVAINAAFSNYIAIFQCVWVTHRGRSRRWTALILLYQSYLLWSNHLCGVPLPYTCSYPAQAGMSARPCRPRLWSVRSTLVPAQVWLALLPCRPSDKDLPQIHQHCQAFPAPRLWSHPGSLPGFLIGRAALVCPFCPTLVICWGSSSARALLVRPSTSFHVSLHVLVSAGAHEVCLPCALLSP